ncbi:UNVERIFIED_ORG: cell division protein FtsB [Paenarthrobacter nicotinovorans]
MATRRPKVPRADALGRPAGTARPAGTSAAGHAAPQDSEDADVIALGASRTADKPRTAGKPTAPRTTVAGTDKAGTGKAGTGKADTGKAGGSKADTGKAGGSKADPGKAGSSKGAAAKPGDTAGKADRDSGNLDPVPAKAFSGRMLALAVVMIAITILLAPTVKIFLEKRAEISALEAEIASRKAEQTELNKQISRWQDPNYVKQQARDRINMVMPGETGYWVFGGEDAAGTPGGRTGSGSTANPENLPWVDALWESIRRSATD